MSFYSIPATAIEEMHRAIGKAITRWQYVETSLYIVTHCMLRTDAARSSAVFFHIESARSKLGVTDKLCRIGLKQDTYQRHWRPIMADVGKAVHFRNALAHFDLTLLEPAAVARGEFGVTVHPIALVPNSHAPASLNGDVKGLHLEQVQDLSDLFYDLTIALVEFVPRHLPDWQKLAASLPPETQQLLANRQSRASM